MKYRAFPAIRPVPLPGRTSLVLLSGPLSKPPGDRGCPQYNSVRRHATGRDMTYIIALGQPTVGEELAALAKVFRSERLAGAGPARRKFEGRFAAAVGTRHAVTTSNCGCALFLGLKVSVLAGQPGDFDQYRAIADKHGLWLCEDAACAADATYQTRPAGSSLTWPPSRSRGAKASPRVRAARRSPTVTTSSRTPARCTHTTSSRPSSGRAPASWRPPSFHELGFNVRLGVRRPGRDDPGRASGPGKPLAILHPDDNAGDQPRRARTATARASRPVQLRHLRVAPAPAVRQDGDTAGGRGCLRAAPCHPDEQVAETVRTAVSALS